MPFRLLPALCVLLLVGCASSEPQNASYALLAAEPIAVAPDPQAAPPVTPAPASLPGAENQAVAFPASDSATSPQADTAATAVLPPGATNCSTVDGVTLCDAPSDSIAGDAGADAFSADDTLYTN